ncbi:ribose ABC transporter permease, partial [Escherichia coli]|nr:ribose ABC transporter permease [Escherichia coli]
MSNSTETKQALLASPLIRQYGGIVISLIILCLVFSSISPRFLAFNNFMNIMQQVAVIAVAAYGMTYVILLGDID